MDDKGSMWVVPPSAGAGPTAADTPVPLVPAQPLTHNPHTPRFAFLAYHRDCLGGLWQVPGDPENTNLGA